MEPLISKENCRLLVDYVTTRADVYYRKEVLKQNRPWTDHFAIKEFYFTNVKRKLDRQSKWAIKYILDNPFLSEKEKALNTALFIIVNNNVAMEMRFGGPILFDSQDFDELLKYEQNRLELTPTTPSQSSAYFLSMCSAAANRAFPQYHGWLTARAAFIKHYEDYIYNAWFAPTMKEAWECISEIPSFGPFIAYQAVTAMSYSEYTKYTDDDFIVVGPGTYQGLNALFYDTLQPIVKAKEENAMVELLRTKFTSICVGHNIPFNQTEILHFMPENERFFTRQDWTNLLCEYSKLYKFRNKVPMRSRYY